MKRLRLLPIVIVPAVVLGLAACSGSGNGGDSKTPTPTPTSTSASGCLPSGDVVQGIDVSGGTVGKSAPTVSKVSKAAASPQEKVLQKGDGARVKTLGAARIAYSVFDAKTGKELISLGYGDTDPQNLDLSQTSTSGFGRALQCAKTGEQFVVTGGATDLGFSGKDPYTVVADVLSYPTKADGAEQPAQDGFPAVTVAKDGEPTIAKGEGDAPTETKVATLAKGDGPAVAEGDSVIVQYKGVLYDTGKEFDSSWSRGTPSVFPQVSEQGLIKGFVTGLVGQTVGSRVEIVVPAADGYGDQAQGSIPAKSTLVFVVDLLAKSTPAG